LQEKYRGKRPMLIHVQTKAGHGAGRATRMMIQERADEWAFLFDQLGVM
jgi:prolyl oligopeptidase